MEEIKCKQVGVLDGGKWDKMHDISKRVYDVNGLSPTLHTCGGGNLEPKILEKNYRVRKLTGQGIIEPITEYELSDKMKKYINSYDDKYKVSDNNLVGNKIVASAVTTREGSTRADASSYISKDLPENTNIAGKDMTRYQVRKLTERECFKLMGVKQEDFEKIRENQSKSSCYHLAGDSIVTTVLMAIFGQMFDVDWETKIDELVEELTND